MNDLRHHTEQLREATKLLAFVENKATDEETKQIAVELLIREIKNSRRELTKPRVKV